MLDICLFHYILHLLHNQLLFFSISSGWLEDYTGNWKASFILTACLFLTSSLIVSMEPLLVRYFMNTTNSDKNENQTSEAKRSPEVDDETGSLLESDGVEVSFTSARISRIYRPYDTDKAVRRQHLSPAPIVDKLDV